MLNRWLRVLAGWAIAFLALPALTAAQPRLFISGGASFEFGEVLQGKTVEHPVMLKNIGSAPLLISKVLPGCGCTGTLLSNDRLAPGDSSVLSVTFNSTMFLGHVEKGVALETNDTSHAHVDIRFNADVIKLFELDPDYLFLKASPDSTTTRTLTITNSGKHEINFLSVSPSSNLVTAKLSRMSIKPGEETTLTGSITPPKPGTYTGNIDITTDDPREPVLSVRYFSWVKDNRSPAAKDRN